MGKIKSNPKPKRFVTSKSKSNSLVSNPLTPTEKDKELPIKFDFSYYRPFSVTTSVFTNFYSSFEDYTSMQQKFIDSIFHFSQFSFNEIFTKTKHSHSLDDKKREVVNAILDEYNFELTNDDIATKKIYQLGQSQGFRIIGYFDLIGGIRYFYPIFADPHHLIYNDSNHNSKDTDNYSYCNSKQCVLKKNISLVSYDDIMPEDCYNCTKLISHLEK